MAVDIACGDWRVMKNGTLALHMGGLLISSLIDFP
jgi:hypothetical protein